MGPPAGSPPDAGAFVISEALLDLKAGTATNDTLLLGFGIEQLSNPADRISLLRSALGSLVR